MRPGRVAAKGLPTPRCVCSEGDPRAPGLLASEGSVPDAAAERESGLDTLRVALSSSFSRLGQVRGDAQVHAGVRRSANATWTSCPPPHPLHPAPPPPSLPPFLRVPTDNTAAFQPAAHPGSWIWQGEDVRRLTGPAGKHEKVRLFTFPGPGAAARVIKARGGRGQSGGGGELLRSRARAGVEEKLP